MPESVNWFLWRIYTSPHIRDSKTEIESSWTLDDLLDAHLVIDAIENANAQR